MLDRLKLHTKLALLVGCFAITLIASIAIGASMRVLKAAERLSRQVGHLSGEVNEVLAGVRAT
jgi:hypothetical protein